MRRQFLLITCLFALLVTCLGCSSNDGSNRSNNWIDGDAKNSAPGDVSTDVTTDTSAGSPAHCCTQATDMSAEECANLSRTESSPSCEGNTGCTSLDEEMEGCESACLACYDGTCVASRTAACDL